MNDTTADILVNRFKEAQKPIIKRMYLAMIMFIGAELMLFSGFIGAFLLLRLSSVDWPPPNQPTLPVFITGINTIVLLTSGFLMSRAWKSINNLSKHLRYMILASILGILFLSIQGYEWVKLVNYGLTLQSSVYGGMFYLIIGTHAIHVAGGLLWLLIITYLSINGTLGNSPKESNKFKASALYWFFVVLLWPFLYLLVYFQ